MPYLSWITDEDLIAHTDYLLTKAEQALKKAKSSFHKNVIDPFSTLFQIAGFNIDQEVWLKAEETRQSQKTLQNHIGTFHQRILGSVEGWEDTGTGGFIDIKSDKAKVIAEIKNKYNTVTGSSLVDKYNDLHHLVMPRASVYHGYTAYFVNIIPKNSGRSNELFTPSDRSTGTRKPNNSLIRKIDGANFYHLVTGNEKALEDLFKILPQVINDIKGKELGESEMNLLSELFNRAYN